VTEPLNEKTKTELHDWCEAAIEGRLSEEQARRLEQLVLNDASARRYYLEALHQNACLRWSVAEPSLLAPESAFLEGASAIADSPLNPSRARRVHLDWRWGVAAALLLIALGIAGRFRSAPGTATVATLSGSNACQWGSGSLPTEDGARLSAGRLRLNEGVARITFDDGAKVTLEAPADLEVVSASRCVLHAGRLVAKVPATAVGFLVDTPSALIKDLGTEFGVNVREEHSADVQVFVGRVDVKHRASGRVEAMRPGLNLRFAPEGIVEFDPLAERNGSVSNGTRSQGEATRMIQISTAIGQGKDAYIRPPIPMRDGPDAMLLVKNTVQPNYNRKAYLGFDLSSLSGLEVVEAKLCLAFAPTGLGFASEVPDATFSVYGIRNEALDDWDERSIRWENAPANRLGGAELAPDQVVLLGRFEIAQGVLKGTREISGAALVDFLNHDTNGLASLVLVRETQGSGRSDLVHGFAGKRHRDLPPPTLKLLAAPRRR